MHTIKLKHYSHDVHVPEFHDVSMWFKHLLKSERFWAVFALIVLLGILITLAIMAGKGGFQGGTEMPYYPYYPYFP